MPKASVPSPCIFTGVHRQTNGMNNLQIQLVQPPRAVLNPCKQSLLFISERHHAALDLHLIARFIKLTHTYDTSSQLRNEVHVG
jgi:hypothetical protein